MAYLQIPLLASETKSRKKLILSLICVLLLGFLIGFVLGLLHPFRLPKTIDTPSNTTTLTKKTIESRGIVVEDGIFWGTMIENNYPKGFTLARHRSWAAYTKRKDIRAHSLHLGCGRMQNRLVRFEDGTRACIRYRQNTDQIQGELFSFYLGQSLNLTNLVPSSLTLVNSIQWPEKVRKDVESAQWINSRPIIMTEFIDDLTVGNIPPLLRPNRRHLNAQDLHGLDVKDLVELAQWSDLIIFDYLIANLDRVVNNLYNYQWNRDMMAAPAHNLAIKADDDKELLVFLDNESGLLHGYRLLDKYEPYHRALLDNLCLFRRSTAEAVKRLALEGNVGDILRDMFLKDNGDDVGQVLPLMPDKSVKILNGRVRRVFRQMEKCKKLFQ